MSDSRVKKMVDEIYARPGLLKALEPPAIFRDRDQQAAPSQLGEWAQFVAASREFMSEELQAARYALDLVTVITDVLAEDVEDLLDKELAQSAGRLINLGHAWQERRAAANLSLLERRVELRGERMQVSRLAATVRQLEHLHREWRAAEFTIDRMIRVTNLRLAMSEV